MKLLYIADGRSPIAYNWISYFIQTGHEVHLISSFPCKPITGLASFAVIPVGMSGIYGHPDIGSGNRGRLLRWIVPVELRTRFRQLVAPLSFPRAAKSLHEKVEMIQPELIHAMRIPFEGMVASMVCNQSAEGGDSSKRPPLLISVWGNDFTLHARSTPIMAHHTRRTLHGCDALHTDCQRDLRLAKDFGFNPTKPSIVLPGGGGVKLDVFFPEQKNENVERKANTEDKTPITIINPRGFRAYVRNDTFFHAIPLVIQQNPNTRFICAGMAGESQAQKWITQLGIKTQVKLLPRLSQLEMAEWFRQSQISLSITMHDGTPNTLIEAMACGCFPVAGDIESLREWITPGVNGLLVDPGDPVGLATAISEAINRPELRRQARQYNIQLVKEQAEYDKVMKAANDFYFQLISNR
jgi:glycosyltransferase involved in cell wall biosynthesis